MVFLLSSLNSYWNGVKTVLTVQIPNKCVMTMIAYEIAVVYKVYYRVYIRYCSSY